MYSFGAVCREDECVIKNRSHFEVKILSAKLHMSNPPKKRLHLGGFLR